MINTLRITGLLVVVFAVLVVGSVLGFVPFLKGDAAGDEQAREVLSSPGAVERFKTQHGGKVSATKDRTPPLVQQAQLLAGILNPPVPQPRPVNPPKTNSTRISRPDVPTIAKFDLVGTSYLAAGVDGGTDPRDVQLTDIRCGRDADDAKAFPARAGPNRQPQHAPAHYDKPPISDERER